MITLARLARPSIVLQGKDYATALAPYFLNMAYTDNCDGKKADDLHIQLADRDMKFINEWMPDLGEFIDAGIIVERWFAPYAASLSLDCGRFWIDEVEFELPPHTVSIKASSIPTTAHIKNINETRGWEKTTLHDIANQIAGENQMSLDWQAGDINPKYSRIEQQEESGLQFLMKRADDAKLAIKVHRNKVVVFDEAKLEQQPAKFTVVYSDATPIGGIAGQLLGGGASSLAIGSGIGGSTYHIKSAHFTLRLTDLQKGHKVKKSSVVTGKTHDSTFKVDEQGVADYQNNVNIGTGEEEEDSDDGEGNGGNGNGEPPTKSVVPHADEPPMDWQNVGGADVAKAKTRKTNKDKYHCDIELSIGNPLIAAGQTFNLQGFGKWDGKWFIESADHTVGPEYTTKLKTRMCLQGY
jgi:phage protein D